jgi:hypothetical protein
MLSFPGIGLTALVVLKELPVAIGLGVLSIVLTFSHGKTNRLAALGIMIILSVVPETLVAFYMQMTDMLGSDLKINVLTYLRSQAIVFVIRIAAGYIIGETLWRKRISKFLPKRLDKRIDLTT